MPINIKQTIAVTSLICASISAMPALAQGPAGTDPVAGQTKVELDSLRAALKAQEQRLEDQARMLEEQRAALDAQRRQLETMQAKMEGEAPAPAGEQVTPQQAAPKAEPKLEGPVAEAPKKERVDVDLLADVGGVLTPEGTFVVEPSLEYTHSSVKRFVFQGVEIVDAVLVGLIEATEADRDTVTAAMAGRYGITDRLEVDFRVPWVYRSDRVTNTVIQTSVASTSNLEANDLGDVEFGAHYQLNRGLSGWPYLVGNVRVKAPTGTGPYDVARDSTGIETELATGSGFWGVEPSVTFIYPTDPAVLFGNIGYLWNMKDDVNKTVGSSYIGSVDPGDSISASFGIAVSLNESTSFSLGYQHDYVMGTETEINGRLVDSDSLQVGSLLFGVTQTLSDSVSLNLNVAVGATEDAPDARVTLRVPVTF